MDQHPEADDPEDIHCEALTQPNTNILVPKISFTLKNPELVSKLKSDINKAKGFRQLYQGW